MKSYLQAKAAIIAICLCCAISYTADESFARMEERVAAEMEAIIDKTGQIPDADDAACRKYLQQGTQEHDKGEYSKAIAFYEKALKISPISSTAYYEMAFSYSQAGDQKKALDAVLRSLVLNPKFEASHVMKASILDDLGLMDDAITAYRKIIEIKPDSFSSHLNLGITLLRKRDFEQAYSHSFAYITN